MYDTEWVNNVWSYTMPEMVDPSIGDEWFVSPIWPQWTECCR